MADKPKNSVSSDESRRKNARRSTAIWLVSVLVAAVALAVGIAIGVLSILPYWFEKNPRLIMRRIELTSKDRMSYNGYWSSRKGLLKRRLGLKDMVSLWDIDPGELRRALEDTKLFSSIQSARVYQVPPDTLRIELTERTPVAFVDDSPLLTDDSCMLIRRRESIVAGAKFPKISGVVPKRAGERDPQLAPAVALIMEARRNVSDIDLEITEIRLVFPEKMYCRFRCGSPAREYVAVFPIRHYERKLPIQLQALKAALIKLRQGGEDRRHFDLSFEGQVVIKDDNTAAAKNNNNNNRRGTYGR